MAKTEIIIAEYDTGRLKLMTQWIKEYYKSDLTPALQERLDKALSDFTFNNSESFKRDFAKTIGLENIPEIENRESANVPSIDALIEELSNKRGQGVFLLRDTQIALDKYQAKNTKGFGIAMNRSYCCRNEEDYFTLIDLVYKALDEAKTVERVVDVYIQKFRELIAEDEFFYKKSVEIAEYVSHHTDPSQPIIFVDYGFQFTFALFWKVPQFSDSQQHLIHF